MGIMAGTVPEIPPWVILLAGIFLLLWVVSLLRLVLTAVIDSVKFPKLEKHQIRFHEGFASGRAQRRWAPTAMNCLKVTVTDTELWIRAFFPLSLYGRHAGLRHRIPLTSIVSVERAAGSEGISMEFTQAQAAPVRLTLVLKKTDDFLKALAQAGVRVSHQNR